MYDAPEQLLMIAVDLTSDWMQWTCKTGFGFEQQLLTSDFPWEGSDQPIFTSMPGEVSAVAHELRDPAIYIEDSRIYMAYAVAGERGLALAEIVRKTSS